MNRTLHRHMDMFLALYRMKGWGESLAAMLNSQSLTPEKKYKIGLELIQEVHQDPDKIAGEVALFITYVSQDDNERGEYMEMAGQDGYL